MPDASLDIEQPDQLLAYLRATGRIGADERVTIRTLAGGVSNRTVLVSRANGESWVLKQALAKLRVQTDWFSDPARIHQEALGLHWLEKLAPPGTITPLIFEDHDHHLLAMRAVPLPHENFKDLLLAGQLDVATLRDYAAQFGRLLGTIHQRAFLNHTELSAIFADRSFFESLRIEPYYTYTATRVPESADFYDRLIAQTRERHLTLVHGDFSPKNILIHDGQLILLDHEVIHWGDPAFDLGFALTHLLSKAHHVAQRRNDLVQASQDFLDSYLGSIEETTAWRATIEQHAVRHTLACLLARVSGRSPLEYLTPPERERQRDAVIFMMHHQPHTWRDLIQRFVAKVTV